MATHCPSCSVVMLPPGEKCNACGWSLTGSKSAESNYPTLADLVNTLSRIISQHKAARRLADDPDASAQRWLSVIEKPASHERPEQAVQNNKTVYSWAYADRATHTLKKFLSLSDADRKIIMAAREDEIFWRGDDMEFFTKVIHEPFKMRDLGLEQYKIIARQQVRELINSKRSVAK